MSDKSAPRVFSLKRKKVSTIDSDYDALEIVADKEYLEMAYVFGVIPVIEKSAYDTVTKERDDLKTKNEKLKAFLNHDQIIQIETLKNSASHAIAQIDLAQQVLGKKWRGEGCQFGYEHLGYLNDILLEARALLGGEMNSTVSISELLVRSQANVVRIQNENDELRSLLAKYEQALRWIAGLDENRPFASYYERTLTDGTIIPTYSQIAEAALEKK